MLDEIEREKYDGLLEDRLTANGWDARCHTDFPELVGMRTSGRETMEEIIALDPPIMSITHVYFFHADDHETAAKEAERIFREARMYGTYTLFFANGEEDKDITALEKNRRKYERMTFNCFDVLL